MLGQLLQPFDDAVEFLRAKLLLAGDAGDVAAQLLEPVVADLDAEVLAGDVFDFVGFIEHHGVIFGQDAGDIFLLDGEVGKKQVMVDDDDVAFGRRAGA